MKRVVQLGVLFLGVACGICRADISSDVDTVLRDKLLQRASVGIEMVRLGASDGQAVEVYKHDSRKPFTPASNLKLVTTSAALDRLGPDFKFRTFLLLHDNDLVLIGAGDPNFGDSEYLRRVGWKITTVYENWAAQLKKVGVTKVRNVIVDDSIFDQDFLHPRWPSNQIDHWYVAEVGGMNLNINCLDLSVDAATSPVRVSVSPPTKYIDIQNSCVPGANAVQIGRKHDTNEVIIRGQASSAVPGPFQETIHDPAMYAATVLAETLKAAGVEVGGKVLRDTKAHIERERSPGQWRAVGVHETPIAVALARANKDSINLYAECFCKLLGHEASHAPGSWENGTAAVGAFLQQVGVGASEFRLDDGSGLSKQNSVSPHALARVLEHDFLGKSSDAFVASLSVAGVDGTLEDRFRGTDLRRRVVGKSGFVEGVSCLSGFLRARDSQWYAFSIMMNGIPYKSNTLAKVLQEKIVRALDNHVTTQAARG